MDFPLLTDNTLEMNKNERDAIIALIKREVVPAVGCTEPAAVSLAVAKATELLGCLPEKIHLNLSGNIIKNAMGVGIPGTGMIGLPIAVALGALIGKSEYQLEVLRDVNPDAVKHGREYIEQERISIALAEDAPDNLWIDVNVSAGEHSAQAVIGYQHTRFVLLRKDEETILDSTAETQDNSSASNTDPELTFSKVWEFATTAPVGEIEFIMEAKKLNKAAAEFALAGDYGHSLGNTLRHHGNRWFGDTPLSHMVGVTSAACDARMGGAPIPVMSNSGSGNQGITATMPVVAFAEDTGASYEQTVRALALSNLTSIYIKQSLGRLSALCGCVVASTAASVALVYLMGGDYDHACFTVKNMVANLTGMICDGAKPACALKISSGVSTAMMSAMMAMNGKCVSSAEGIVCDDVDQTVHNLTGIGREAMSVTDRYVLNLMTHKC